MSTDFRALCAELLDEVAARPLILDRELIDRARAALAEPVAEGPTDEELLGLDDLERAWNAQADAANSWDELGLDEIIVWAQRQALARWGRPAPPAEGEIAELVSVLRLIRLDVAPCDGAMITRAADLLEQRHPTPVPVAERLPGPEDCDAEGRCWWFLPARQLEILRQSGAWSLRKHTPRKDDYCRWTHWLSATALPLPQGEVQP